ncbi:MULTISPECIES: hypothetical protein [unclassified Pseudoclavibacter]|nr:MULTISPECIES: hypothetical protein [unclassified Pseudoclavibacter]
MSDQPIPPDQPIPTDAANPDHHLSQTDPRAMSDHQREASERACI